MNDLAKTIFASLFSKKPADDVCAGVAKWCATRKSNCSDDEVWRIALAAFGINSIDKRDMICALLLRLQEPLLPRLSDHQLFNLLCNNLAKYQPDETLPILSTGILRARTLTVLTLPGRGPMTQMQRDAIQAYLRSDDDKDMMFVKNFLAITYKNKGDGRADWRNVPWHEDHPQLTTNAVAKWIVESSTNSTNFIDSNVDYATDASEMRNFWDTKFAPAFGFEPLPPVEDRFPLIRSLPYELHKWLYRIFGALREFVINFQDWQKGAQTDDLLKTLREKISSSEIFKFSDGERVVRNPLEWAFPQAWERDNMEKFKSVRNPVYYESLLLGFDMANMSVPITIAALYNMLASLMKKEFQSFLEWKLETTPLDQMTLKTLSDDFVEFREAVTRNKVHPQTMREHRDDWIKTYPFREPVMKRVIDVEFAKRRNRAQSDFMTD